MSISNIKHLLTHMLAVSRKVIDQNLRPDFHFDIIISPA